MSDHERFIHCDPATCLAMVDNDQEAFAELATMFVDMAAPQIAELEAAAANRDAKALGERAHALKGSLAIFRATPALTIVERIEQLVREQAEDTADVLVAQLRVELDALCVELARCAAAGSGRVEPVHPQRSPVHPHGTEGDAT